MSQPINATLQPIVDDIILALESNLANAESVSWVKTLKIGGIQYNHESGHRYTGGNILLLWRSKVFQDFESNQMLTFNQIKKLNLTLRKGSKSFVLFPYLGLKLLMYL